MTKRTQHKGAGTTTGWKERDQQAFVLVAVCAYLASLFLAWWEVTEVGDSGQPDHVIHLAGLGSSLGGTNRLRELCVVIAIAVFVLTITALRPRDRRLLLALRQLAIALVLFTVLSVFELWRSMDGGFMSLDFYRGGHPSYGAYAAIGTSLLVLLSVLVLEAGGLRELLRRRSVGP